MAQYNTDKAIDRARVSFMKSVREILPKTYDDTEMYLIESSFLRNAEYALDRPDLSAVINVVSAYHSATSGEKAGQPSRSQYATSLFRSDMLELSHHISDADGVAELFKKTLYDLSSQQQGDMILSTINSLSPQAIIVGAIALTTIGVAGVLLSKPKSNSKEES